MVNTQDISLVQGGENVTQRNAQGGLNKTTPATFVPQAQIAIQNQTPASTTPSAPNVTSTTPFDASKLQSAPNTSNPPEQPPATQTDNLLGTIAGGTAQTTAGLQQQAASDQKLADNSFAGYLQAKLNTTGRTQATSDAYAQKGGVNDLQKQLNDINQQILSEQHGLLRQTQAIDENAQGRFGTAVQEMKNEAQNASLKKQADLYIIQQGIQGQYDSAKAIADRAVDAYTEQQQNKIDTLQEQYNRYQDLFTKSEQRAFDAAQADRQRKLDEQKQNQTDIYNLAIQAQQDGAPVSVVQQMLKATTKEDALAAGGSYIGALDRAQKYASIASSNTSTRKNLLDLANAGDPTAIKQLGFDPTDSNSQEKVANVQAYGQQYASTGKLPSPAELKQSGLTISDVTNFAKQSPKPDGALVSADTGVTPSNLSAAQQTGIQSLSEIVNQTIPSLKDKFSKLNAGLLGKAGSFIYTTQDRQDYNTLRQDFLSKLLLARSGAAVSEQEYERLSNLVPTDIANAGLGGLSNKGDKALNSLESSMTETLNSQLKNNNLAIYGYSTVNVPSLGEKKVGEIVTIGGTQYKVLPDGNLTDIIQ